MCQGRLMAALGIFVTLYNMAWCSFIIVYNIHIPLFKSKSVTMMDYLIATITAGSMILSLLSYFRVCLVSPGAPPSWLSEGRVEGFVREVLGNIVRNGAHSTLESSAERCHSEANETAIPLTYTVADEQVSANRALAAAQEKRNELREGDDPTALEMVEMREPEEDPDTVKTKINEEPQQRNSQTETSIRDVTLAAADALEAMDRSRESFEQEISFLLGGARLCRFCRIYKLDDTLHCSTCRTCVHGMDQHCPLFGQCVGHNNHKMMLLFVLYTAITAVLLLFHTTIVMHRWGLNVFDNDNPGIFTFAVVTIVAFAVVLIVFFIQSSLLLLRGEGTMRLIRKEERSYLAAQRRAANGGTFSILLDDETEEAPPKPISLSNLRRSFGTGAVLPWWFLPLMPQRPIAADQEEAFRTVHRGLIEQQLRILAEGDNAANGEEIVVSTNQRARGWGEGKRRND